MNHLPEHELLSAYLDGELTADEQARVEQLLAGSPAARQQLEEMRALSATLQSLPVNRVNENLGERVLRMAERRMLSEAPQPASVGLPPGSRPGLAGAAAEAPQPASVSWQSVGRQLRQPRTWLWPAVAAVVAVMLYVQNPQMQEKAAPQLARAPEAREPVAEMPAEAPSIRALGVEENAPEVAMDAARRDRYEKRKFAERLADEGDVIPDSASAPTDAPAEDMMAGQPAPAPRASAPAAEPKPTSAPEFSKREEKADASGLAKSGAADKSGAPAAGGEGPGRGMFAKKGYGGGMAGKTGSLEMPAAEAEQTERLQTLKAPEPTRPSIARKDKSAIPAVAGRDEALPLLVVRVDVTPEAARQGAVEQFFARRLQRQNESTRRSGSGAMQNGIDELAKESLDREAAFGRDRLGGAEGQAHQKADEGGSTLEFEATREQVLALVADLKAQPEAFVAVSELSVSAQEESGQGQFRQEPMDSFEDFDKQRGSRSRSLSERQDLRELKQQGAASEPANQAKSQARPSAPAGAAQQAIPDRDDGTIGAMGQDPRSRAGSQVRLPAEEDRSVIGFQAAAGPATAKYRVRLEVRVIADAAVAADRVKASRAMAAEPPAAEAAAEAAAEPPAAAAPPPPAEKP